MHLDIATPKTLPRHCATALLCACMALGLLLAPEGAHAARQKKATTAAATPASEPAKKKGSVKVKHQAIRSDSQESTAARDRRLYRECQGRPNAGACAGYTQR